MEHDVPYVLERLEWMRAKGLWPNGPRHLWTDAFGLGLLVSLNRLLDERSFLDRAEELVGEVEGGLGRPRGLRIGSAPEQGGQYFHHLAMWAYSLTELGHQRPGYHERAVELVRAIHPRFVVPGVGVYWRMKEDLSGPVVGFGFGALNPFLGYVVYRHLDEEQLAREIQDMRALVEASWRGLRLAQDLGLGMMLWTTHFWPAEEWAIQQRSRSLETLDRLWQPEPGYFAHTPERPGEKYAFSNYAVSLGLQAVGAQPERVERLNTSFEEHRSEDPFANEPVTPVMGCVSHLPRGFIVRPPIPEEKIGTPPEVWMGE